MKDLPPATALTTSFKCNGTFFGLVFFTSAEEEVEDDMMRISRQLSEEIQ
jgi:hypothetical protein